MSKELKDSLIQTQATMAMLNARVEEKEKRVVELEIEVKNIKDSMADDKEMFFNLEKVESSLVKAIEGTSKTAKKKTSKKKAKTETDTETDTETETAKDPNQSATELEEQPGVTAQESTDEPVVAPSEMPF